MFYAELTRGEGTMKSTITKRTVAIHGRMTGVTLEEPFWTSLKEIAAQREVTVSELVGEIDRNRTHSNLSSAIRLFVLRTNQNEITNRGRPRPFWGGLIA